MVLDVPVQRPLLYQPTGQAEGEAGLGEYSEQVLRLMHSLGIDQHKTVEVRVESLGLTPTLRVLSSISEVILFFKVRRLWGMNAFVH